MKKLVVFTGSGISAESGIRTFRDSGGLWENHRVEDVATPKAWYADRKLVLEFYNQRRKQVIEANPNEAHEALVKLESYFEVQVITQNVDDLHERAGSKSVLHLHGEIRKSRSTIDENLIYTISGWELKEGDTCELGSQLRPHIVWFGEQVPEMNRAASIVSKADLFLTVGTSLVVYPASGLCDYTRPGIPKFLVDPNASHISVNGFTLIDGKAAEKIPTLVEKLIEEHAN